MSWTWLVIEEELSGERELTLLYHGLDLRVAILLDDFVCVYIDGPVEARSTFNFVCMLFIYYFTYLGRYLCIALDRQLINDSIDTVIAIRGLL